jgi:hypothetical protein
MADTTAGLTGTLILGALTFKTIDLIKYAIALAKHWTPPQQESQREAAKKTHDEAFNGFVTLLIGCVAGIGIVLLFAQTGLAGDVKVGDTALSDLTFASKIALGLAMTSVAGVLFDAKKAVDSSDSASKPKITKPAEQDRQEMLKQTLAGGD